MKKIFASLLLALTTMGASAQDNPNRLIIQPKQGNPSGYLVERLDSVYFTKINGRVAADINLQGYTTGTTGDTLRLAVTKTPECQAYKIACLPASVANALTSDAVVAQYFDLYVGGDKFTEDFTNAVMTNMGIEFKPNSDYSVITMGYDKRRTRLCLPLVSFHDAYCQHHWQSYRHLQGAGGQLRGLHHRLPAQRGLPRLLCLCL